MLTRHLSFASRRLFIVVSIFLMPLLLTPGEAAQARQTTPNNVVIGEIALLPPTYTAALHASLTQLGYIEGKNITYLPPSPATPVATGNATPAATAAAPIPTNDPAALAATAQLLVSEKVDLIVAYGTSSAIAAQKAVAGTNIPIVFVGSVDPVGLGLVKSLANTDGNITGVAGTAEAYSKQLEWLLRLNPAIKRVYIPNVSLQIPVIASAMKAIQSFADKSGVQVISAVLPTPADVSAVLANFPDVDAIMLLPFSPQANDFVTLSLQRKLPLSSYVSALAVSGALFSYNYSEATLAPAAAAQIDQILRGAKPSALPIQLASNSLVINLKTAKAIGLTIPNDVLQQAATIIR